MSKEAVQNWRTRTKERMVEAMGGKCQICGYNKCISVLEFHHLDFKEKEFTFSQALKNPSSWDKLVVELRKCVLLCANCRREVHFGDSKVPTTAEGFNEEHADYKAKAKRELLDNCPVCDVLKSKHSVTCSHSCAAKLSRKVDWENVDLDALLKRHKNAEQVGKHLGVSGAAVRKRIKRELNK